MQGKNSKKINYKQFKQEQQQGQPQNEQVCPKIFTGWEGEYDKNYRYKKTRPKLASPLNEKDKKEYLKKLKKQEVNSNQELNFQTIDEKNIKKILEKYPNCFLFWARAHIANIYAVKNNEDMKYWRNYENIWEEERNHQIGYEDDLTGETTSSTVARINNLITIQMVKNNLDGKGANWDQMGEMFARATKGAVFFLTGAESENDLDGTVWRRTERKALMNNDDVNIIVELDLKNPEKVNSIIVKNGLKNAQKYGFELSNINNLSQHEMFFGNFKMKFKENQIMCVEVDANGAEFGEQRTFEQLASGIGNQRQQQQQLQGMGP